MDPSRWEQLETLLRHFNGAVKALGLYPASHPASVKFQKTVLRTLELLLADQESVQMGLSEDNLIVLEGTPWMGPGEQVEAFMDRLRKRDVGAVTFLRGVTVGEVRLLLEVLSMDPGALAARGGAGRALAEQGAQHLAATSLKPSEKTPTAGAMDRRQAVLVYNKALGAARAMMKEVRMGKVPQGTEVRQVVADLTDAVFKDKHVVLAFTMLKSYDEYLFNHSVNVGILAVALGHHLGLDEEVLREVGLGAFLHDIGKVNWPETLYRKPRDLSPSEWELVRRHPMEGAKILDRMGGSPIARSIVLEHHVRFDLGERGYPSLPPGKEATLYGRLACVADSYDAMTTHRPYQQGVEPSKAVAQIQTLTGTVYDPKLVEAFAKMVGIYPAGSLVRLDTRELAVVVRPQEEPTRPMVRLVADTEGSPLPDGPEVDLQEKNPLTRQYARSIVMAVDASSKNIDVAQFLTEAA